MTLGAYMFYSMTLGIHLITCVLALGVNAGDNKANELVTPENRPAKQEREKAETEPGTDTVDKIPNEMDERNANKKFYLKLEPRIYNTDFSTEAYGGVIRVGTTIRGNKNTTIIEVGPQVLEFKSEQIRSIDGAIESYWSITNALEAYGRWYPSYVDGYGTKDLYNTFAAGIVARVNGGVVNVNEYTGLASLSKGQYIKVQQDLSTYSGFLWSGNTTSTRLGWAASGKKWSLAVEAGAAYLNDLFKGKRIRPSALFEYYYNINRNTSLSLTYYPNTDAGFDGPIRGQLGLALIQKF
jgi:hypothetical protein